MSKNINSKILVRRDSSTNWTTNNPILASGQIGFDTTKKKHKIGDGVTTWNNLEYFALDSDIDEKITEALDQYDVADAYEIAVVAPIGGISLTENAVTATPNYTPSGDIYFTNTKVNVVTGVSFNYSYQQDDCKLYIYNIIPTVTPVNVPADAIFEGSPVELAIKERSQ